MSRIKNTFTYNIPDDYVSQTNVNGSSASFTYRGPQYLELSINKENSVIMAVNEGSLEDWQTRHQDGKTMVSHYDYPLETAILWGRLSEDSSDQDSDVFPHRTIDLPDGDANHVFKYPWPPFPWKAYDNINVQWNKATQSFNSLDWHQSWINWGDIGAQAETIIIKANDEIARLEAADSDFTDLIAEWNAYKTEAQNKISVYRDANLQPHQVVWTRAPDQEDLPDEITPDTDSAE